MLESWIHLQDIRDALLEPADDHGPGEEIVVNRFEAALPYVVGKRVGAPERSYVRINLSGRLARSIRLVVRDGRAITVEDGRVNVDDIRGGFVEFDQRRKQCEMCGAAGLLLRCDRAVEITVDQFGRRPRQLREFSTYRVELRLARRVP